MKVATPRRDEPIRLIWTRLDPVTKKPTEESEPRYRVVIDVSPDPIHRKQATSTHKTLTDARAHVAKVRVEVEQGTWTAPDKTPWTVCADAWLARRARKVRPITLQGYRSALQRSHRAWGTTPVSKIGKSDVERLIHAMADEGHSRRTAEFTLFVLRSIFAELHDEGLIQRNPAARVEPIGRDAEVRVPLSTDDQTKLRKQLRADPLWACWALSLMGLRRSEVMGLQWSDIDLTAGTVKIERGVVQAPEGGRSPATPPKTRRGRRTLYLAHVSELLDALRALRRAQLAEWGTEQVRTGWVCIDAAGRPMQPQLWTKLWRTACEAAGVPHATLHSARHASVTSMRAAGVPDHIVAAHHGHDEVIMRRVYSHADADALADAARALAAGWNDGKTGTSHSL